MPPPARRHTDDRIASRFRKETERAAAGWYAVRLEDDAIDVELTAID